MDEVPGCTLLHERLLQLGVLQREFVRWMRGEGRVASCMGVKEITLELILRRGFYRKSFYPKRFRSMSGHNNNKNVILLFLNFLQYTNPSPPRTQRRD